MQSSSSRSPLGVLSMDETTRMPLVNLALSLESDDLSTKSFSAGPAVTSATADGTKGSSSQMGENVKRQFD